MTRVTLKKTDIFAPLPQFTQASMTEKVFDVLYNAVVSLDLKPGMRISESEVAHQLDVSRQPVRDAFFRLSKLGFVEIRPQRATLITKISEPAVMQAQYVRLALELAVLHDVIDVIDDEGITLLQNLLDQQEASKKEGDRVQFYALDDEFHRQISLLADRSYVWTLIREHKAHMDRVRYLSLSFGSELTFQDHQKIFRAISARDHDHADQAMRAHLSRIREHIKMIRAENEQYFDETLYEL